ncbi:hypothetical protein B0H17DRAFT_1123693 [Mycena rosella]|uniref:Uncharacterized protein n=1 Tax=Mycena rosella TaxID=1033263 RepID=A0AAD7MCK0_MYCRO|nr:hypothetical protein B0H17DRAFT_1123693 [Mycena rosella]
MQLMFNKRRLSGLCGASKCNVRRRQKERKSRRFYTLGPTSAYTSMGKCGARKRLKLKALYRNLSASPNETSHRTITPHSHDCRGNAVRIKLTAAPQPPQRDHGRVFTYWRIPETATIGGGEAGIPFKNAVGTRLDQRSPLTPSGEYLQPGVIRMDLPPSGLEMTVNGGKFQGGERVMSCLRDKSRDDLATKAVLALRVEP